MDDRDFARVARAALDNPSAWLPELMGGKQIGREWVGERTKNGGIGNSWSFNLDKGTWAHFSGPERGIDAISLVAAVYRLTQGAAYDWLSAHLGGDRSPNPHVRVLPRVAALEPADEPWELIPEDAPDPDWGRTDVLEAVYRYGRDFWISRHATEDGKTFKWWTWRGGKWRTQGPRGGLERLFHVELLDVDPKVPVLIVEGEKCVLAAQRVLSGFNVVTWAGGTQRWNKANWEPLRGRRVVIWPDQDAPGRHAGAKLSEHLASIVSSVRVVQPPEDSPPGWDIADAIEEGWTVEQLINRIRNHSGSEIPRSYPNANEKKPHGEITARFNGSYPDRPLIAKTSITLLRSDSDDSSSALVGWASMGLNCNQNGIPHPDISNAALIIAQRPEFRGHIWFDEFRERVYHDFHGTPQPWTDDETREVTVRIQQQYKLHKFNITTVYQAIRQIARVNARNPLTKWLLSLEWSGEDLLTNWLADCAGVDLTEYSMAVSRNWPIAMVARALRPGCEVHNMPVVEGKSDIGKTSFLKLVGGEYYKALNMDFGTKDFYQSLQGGWLIEIQDMGAFEGIPHAKVIASLTTPNDTYRPSYGQFSQDFPRKCLFVASSETADYLPSGSGKRRWWPTEFKHVDLAVLARQREQIFAQAVHCYRNGETWHKVPESAKDEQSKRIEADGWAQLIFPALERWWVDIQTRGEFADDISITRILIEAIDMPKGQITPGHCRRVAKILRSSGQWREKPTSSGTIWVKHIRALPD